MCKEDEPFLDDKPDEGNIDNISFLSANGLMEDSESYKPNI